jgi:hypothetical protein
MRPVRPIGHAIEPQHHTTMIKQALILSLLLCGLRTETARSQVYVPFVFTNILASSSGGTNLLGIGLGPNTTVQGVFISTLYNEGSQIQFILSDGTNSVIENFHGNFNYIQDLSNNSLTFSSVSSTPWGGLFQDVVYLPTSAMSPNINQTLINVAGFRGPGVAYDQYHSVVTISDGATTSIFGVGPVPEPSTLALSAVGGLAGFLVLRRRS